MTAGSGGIGNWRLALPSPGRGRGPHVLAPDCQHLAVAGESATMPSTVRSFPQTMTLVWHVPPRYPLLGNKHVLAVRGEDGVQRAPPVPAKPADLAGLLRDGARPGPTRRRVSVRRSTPCPAEHANSNRSTRNSLRSSRNRRDCVSSGKPSSRSAPQRCGPDQSKTATHPSRPGRMTCFLVVVTRTTRSYPRPVQFVFKGFAMGIVECCPASRAASPRRALTTYPPAPPS